MRCWSFIGRSLLLTPTLTVAVSAAHAGEAAHVLVGGSANHLANNARTAIKCGFDVVTVRPWQDGDIDDIDKPRVPNPKVLVVQPPASATDQDLNRIFGCFYDKTGYNKLVVP